MCSFIHAINVVAKKSLKISKGKSESVNRRRADNIMVKRKSTKGETISDLQNNTYNIKDRVTRTPIKTGGTFRCSGRVGSSCSTTGTVVLLQLHPGDKIMKLKSLFVFYVDEWDISMYHMICLSDIASQDSMVFKHIRPVNRYNITINYIIIF